MIDYYLINYDEKVIGVVYDTKTYYFQQEEYI